MADIIIKGMEMPKNCLYCHFVSYDNDHCVAMNKDIPIYGTKPSWCPLFPLPDGHGRLIDADALRKEFPEPEDWIDFAQAVQHITGIRATIDNAPTIVPAEGGSDDVQCL